jgi:predicted RNase H-like nuclease (RuvC/YqgF family)
MNIDDIIENAQLKGRVIGLEAQVETLTAEVRCLEAVIRAHERIDCQAVTNLKAEVERLTKELENTDCMFAMASAFARDWNAAKEGN